VVRKEYHYSLGRMVWKEVEAGRPIQVEGPARPAGEGWEVLLAVPKVTGESGEWKLLWVWEREIEDDGASAVPTAGYEAILAEALAQRNGCSP
jgi:hypothetical protein